jgi:hypothetical protein
MIGFEGRGVVVRQGLCLVMLVCAATVAGLAAIHFIWLHPAIIGPFALMIGMTPLVVLFEFSLEISGYWFPLGAVLAGASWLALHRNPPGPMAAKVILVGGGVLVVTAVIVFILASAHYNVGMADEIPLGWYSWVRPGSRVGEVGLLVLAIGLLIRATLAKPPRNG